jgi:hypothetical protein
MVRLKTHHFLLGTLALFAAISMICVLTYLFSILRNGNHQLTLAFKTIEEANDTQIAEYRRVKQSYTTIPENSRLSNNWDFVQSMDSWDTREVESLAKTAKQFLRGNSPEGVEQLATEGEEKFRRFVIDSSLISELLEAIDYRLCAIPLDYDKGPWLVTNTQIKTINTMALMLSSRALLLAKEGDTDSAMKTVLSGFGLMDMITDIPSIKLQTHRASMLLYLKHALCDGANPYDISLDSKSLLLKHLEKQSSQKAMTNALLLHEAIVIKDVARTYSNAIASWHLAGYHEGIQSLVDFLNNPSGSSLAISKAIVDDAPLYAGQTSWRLQNVADILQSQENVLRRIRSIRLFLGQNRKSDYP